MRHRVAHRKLGRVTEHRIALLRNQAEALLRHERIETTVPKARELRPFVERLITIAKRSLKEKDGNGASAANGAAATPATAARAAKIRTMTARRLVEADLHNKKVVAKLFDTIAPRFEGRPGGYTRLLKIGNRRGDNAEVAQVELVGSEYNPALDKPEAEVEAPAKGVRGRLAAAASRLRGEKKDADSGAAAEGGEAKKPKTVRKKAAPRKTT
jgi:large subunit ribosomal protein L17